ncbi:MAG TPA: MMPL family transporter [Baekduia sp.]|nr:MMPL family transporter [Baekduia sp.]
MGRWSARHWKTAVGGWLLFVALAFMIGGNVGTKSLTTEEAGVRDSGIAAKAHLDAYPKSVSEMVLVSSSSMKADAPRFKAAVADVVRHLRTTRGVHHVTDPYAGHVRGAISDNGHLAMVGFEVPGTYEIGSRAKLIVDGTVAQTKRLDAAHGDVLIEQFGDGSAEEAFKKIFNADLAKAGSLSLPLTLVILLVTFGTLIAAGLPLLLAISAVMATFGLIGPISQLMPVDESIKHVVLLIGLAVGVDYALFYLRRMREERAAGRSPSAAVDAAAATSGRSILVSGVTVITAMAGMYLAGAPTFTSFATGSITVVAVAMLGSLTVLPALLSRLGDRVDKTRVPGLGRLKARVARVGLWSRVVDGVLRRPLLSALAAIAVLVALAVPAVGLDTGTPEMADSLPEDQPVVQTFNRLRDAFPAETSAMRVVVKAQDVTDAQVTHAIAALQDRTHDRADLFPQREDADVDVSPDHRVATLDLETAGIGTSKASAEALDVLRDEIVPATIGAAGGAQAYVDGETAQDRDFNDQMKANLPLVFGFVLLTAFIVLLVTFRSIVVPIKAIVLNLLSVAASYGAMVLVFQHGWFKSLLGFQQTGPIVAWLPMFLFVVLFGLSMDYHVFILSRVKELVDRGVPTEEAVARSIKTTAGVVTSAAVVMVGVFALFGSLSFLVFKQMGVGLAFAVLLDATLIRGVLLPASMTLLGSRNWWLPRSLGWLPRVGHVGRAGREPEGQPTSGPRVGRAGREPEAQPAGG